MAFRGPALIALSALCLVAAGLAHEKHNGGQLSKRLAQITTPDDDCRGRGVATTQGYVGCFQPVSGSFGEFMFGSSYAGGSAMNRR